VSDTGVLPEQARWIIGERNRPAEDRLCRELGVHRVVAALLVQRGFAEPEAAEKFLHPSLDDLHPPHLLPDYTAASQTILGALERKEQIYVHGDYDVDGVSSAAMFHRFLSKRGAIIHTHVPHRMTEGYGIHLDAVEAAIKLNTKLFLTCDCGIAAHSQVEKAKEAGLKVVITDHHAIADRIPDADAVVNPHRSDSQYPYPDLCGAGVAFKLCQGLAHQMGLPIEGFRNAYLDLATLGTIADVMPLTGENRIIAKHGLQRLRDTKKPGLIALMRHAQVGQDPTKPLLAYHVGWQLGPRLNAVGRLEAAETALRLLIEDDPKQCDQLAHRLEQVNQTRKSRTIEILREAEEMVIEHGYDKLNVIMVASQDWHPGIVGIVAGRLVQRFRRPCFVLSLDTTNGLCKGSGRSIPTFHLAEAIWAFPSLMSGGGHAMAAGCSFPSDRLDDVREALNAYAGERLTPEDFRPTVSIDMELNADEATMKAAEALSDMEPFGVGNPEPSFFARSVALCQIRPTSNPKHVRLVLKQQTFASVPGIAFGIGESLSEVGAGAELDLIFKPEVNEFRGARELQWTVSDFRQPE
jgi:single-stranded-DNA-specific exonuclease